MSHLIQDWTKKECKQEIVRLRAKLTAAESELAALRKDRETLKRLRTMAKNANNISLGASIRHADAAMQSQEKAP